MPGMTREKAVEIVRGIILREQSVGIIGLIEEEQEALTVLLQSPSSGVGEEEKTAEEKRVLAKLGLPIIEAIELRDYVNRDYVNEGKIFVSLDVTRNKVTLNINDKDCIASMFVKAFNEKYHNHKE